MTQKELEKIASDNTNDIISSLDIISFSKDDLILLLGKIIHYYLIIRFIDLIHLILKQRNLILNNEFTIILMHIISKRSKIKNYG
ncbi:MAG: hypothetical protein ABR980_12435 [Ignavibacteriaceae bacterium]|jgi:hypothetical protein